jgi:hypothetical protein
MEEKIIRNFQIQEFSDYLIREEKSNAHMESTFGMSTLLWHLQVITR